MIEIDYCGNIGWIFVGGFLAIGVVELWVYASNFYRRDDTSDKALQTYKGQFIKQGVIGFATWSFFNIAFISIFCA